MTCECEENEKKWKNERKNVTLSKNELILKKFEWKWIHFDEIGIVQIFVLRWLAVILVAEKI